MAGGSGGGGESYLSQLPAAQQKRLSRANEPGMEKLSELLETGDAVTFLGAGASAPLYPLWANLILELIDAAAPHLDDAVADTCRATAASSPDSVVEILRRRLGTADYREMLRKVFRPRRDVDTGKSWTVTHELVARCDFAGVVTTNYDPGIVNARMAVRPRASGTGFASWTDDDAMDRWRTGDVFGDDELPVLYAHGHHNQPDSIVLATTEYRRAYGGKLAKVLGSIVESGHLVWIGFGFGDQRIAAIMREIAERSGSSAEPGAAPRHVAIIPWDPDAGEAGPEVQDPATLRTLMEIQAGCRVVLYPAPGGDHRALHVLLETLTDSRFPPVDGAVPPVTDPEPAASTRGSGGLAAKPIEAPTVEWAHGGEAVDPFTGRGEEMNRLDRWAAEREVRLIGVTAWGGAGKTSLVTEWLTARGGLSRRPGAMGGFAWSFYENRSSDEWANELLKWASRRLGVTVTSGSLANRVLALLTLVPLVLLLDGLEVTQEGPDGTEFGHLLDGTLRSVLTGACELEHAGLVVLTSRFPFADLERFDGVAARMLDVPPFTPSEGAELLGHRGSWLPLDERMGLVEAVDGHALAVGVLAGMLADGLATPDRDALRAELEAAGHTDARVAKVLGFYADCLSERDRWLTALVSLFQRPINADAILSLGTADELGLPLDGWTGREVEEAVRQRLGGLLTWHSDGAVSAHPLVRDTFRPLALTGTAAQLASSIALADMPNGTVASREDALRVVEMIELLLEADEWQAADDLFTARTSEGRAWLRMPAVRLGQRCGTAFVASAERRRKCRDRLSVRREGFFLNGTGLYAKQAGDLSAAQAFMRAGIEHDRAAGDRLNTGIALANLAACEYQIGHPKRSCSTAYEALSLLEVATGDGIGVHQETALCCAALAHGMAGETAIAEERFLEGGRRAFQRTRKLPYSTNGLRWASFLLRSGRSAPAARLNDDNLSVCKRNQWNADMAGCLHIRALCSMQGSDTAGALADLISAIEALRDGDYLMELGYPLVASAECYRRLGQLEEAERSCGMALTLATPRSLVPVQAASLVVRARLRGDLYVETNDRNHLERARDDAHHALRLASQARSLPWIELDGIEAHARLDTIEGRDRDWARQSEELRAALLPTTLDPDPVAAVQATDAD